MRGRKRSLDSACGRCKLCEFANTGWCVCTSVPCVGVCIVCICRYARVCIVHVCVRVCVHACRPSIRLCFHGSSWHTQVWGLHLPSPCKLSLRPWRKSCNTEPPSLVPQGWGAGLTGATWMLQPSARPPALSAPSLNVTPLSVPPLC